VESIETLAPEPNVLTVLLDFESGLQHGYGETLRINRVLDVVLRTLNRTDAVVGDDAAPSGDIVRRRRFYPAHDRLCAPGIFLALASLVPA